MSVISELCLPSVVCLTCGQLSAYPRFCRGLKYLLKVSYIILFVSYVTVFLISNTFLLRDGNTALCLKNTSQKWAAFAFGSTYLHQTFTKSVSNQYTHYDISICQMWLEIMEGPLILLRSLVFSYIIDEHLCLKYGIFTKL